MSKTFQGHPGFLSVLEEVRRVHLSKGHDYGTTGDTFANVRASQEFGIPSWQGVAIRMNDKMQRIKSFCVKGSLKHESIEDAFLDLCNYAAIALTLYRESNHLESEQKKDPAHHPAPETVVCQDWHNAVREIRTGTPNSAMSAVIAPTPSTPGWMDKAAETLVEKRIDSDEEIYQWGGGRWQISNDKTFCWNARECAWNESTLTPSQLRQDGTRVTN